jgi:hypothetical protein
MHLLIVGGMLALVLSASLTPANARGFCGNSGVAGIYCHCIRQCDRDARHDHTPLLTRFGDKKDQAYQAKCVNASEAARR